MKIFFTLLFVLLTPLVGISQTLIGLARPYDKKEWGFVNLKGEFIIQPEYRKTSGFSKEGYAPALDEKTGKFIFIDKKGEKLKTDLDFVLIGTLGTNFHGFSNGLAPVRLGGNWGYMNVQGKEAIKAMYEKISEFSDGYAVVEKAEKKIILDVTGKETVVTDPKIFAVKHFEEGLAPFDTKERQSGFVDPTGKIVIEAKFGSVGYFKDGLAWARAADGQLGYINKKGEWIIKPQFQMTKDFDVKSGVARVKTGEKWGYIDKSGKVIEMNNGSESFDDFAEGLCSGKKGGKVGFYDKTGKWIIEPKFDGVRDFKNGYAAAKMVDKWGIIDTSGKWIIQPILGAIKDMELAD
jgi:hypothetical protein